MIWLRCAWRDAQAHLFRLPCPGCRRPTAAHLCESCEDAIAPLPLHRCSRCAYPLGELTLCPECEKRSPHFQNVTAIGRYEGPLKAVITSYKFYGRLELRHWLGRQMAEVWRGGLRQCDLIIPMPLHPNRARSRGYDQSQLLADQVAYHLHLPVASDAIARRRETETQNRLTRAERSANVQGAFAHRRSLAGRRILLIDDVFTSGFTAQAATEALLAADASSVHILVAARATYGDDR